MLGLRPPVLLGLLFSTVILAQECSNGTFLCSNNRCIPITWRCDGDIDCPNGEDEKSCPVKTCQHDEFQCGTNGTSAPGTESVTRKLQSPVPVCIPAKWKCDGDFDCEDHSDEKNCPDINCDPKDKFQCSDFEGSFKLCIPLTWKCDGQNDCINGMDERNCTKKECGTKEFKCDNDVCIFDHWRCDGEDDCGDKSDERNCSKVEDKCNSEDKFKCKTGETCIPKTWQCDGEVDCLDHSDEQGCAAVEHECKSDFEFACKTSRTCVSKQWVCDGEEDCSDGSDEVDCHLDTECDPHDQGKFMCKNGKQCVLKISQCDGVEDCQDGSDEVGCPTVNDTKLCDDSREFTCSSPPSCIPLAKLCRSKEYDCVGICRNNFTLCNESTEYCECFNSYVGKEKHHPRICHCKDGYAPKNGQCIDVDECATPGTCDQLCVNTNGGFRCGCHVGYQLTHGPTGSKGSEVPRRCRATGADPLLLLSNRATIRQYDLVTNQHEPLVSSPGSAVAMDVHINNNTLIWSDIQQQKIFSCKLNTSPTKNAGLLLIPENDCKNATSVLVDVDVHTPDGLAVDWVHNLLFWTDGARDEVNVMDLTTKKRRVLFKDDLEEPRAIAVDPSLGLIFWTDWGKNARIERAGMDGQNRVIIVSGDYVQWPNGLAIDLLEKRIYWADAKVKSIFSANYWGEDTRVVLRSHNYLRHPFSIAVFEERIFYTDWEHDGVMTVNKFTGDDVMGRVTTPMTVRIYHPLTQPDHPNKCVDHGCLDLCLPKAEYKAGKRENEKQRTLETPYQCLCQGIELGVCAVSDLVSGEAHGFSLTTMLFFLLVAVCGVALFVWHRRRPTSFTALNFDNPVYRRTTEPDMEDPFRDPFREEQQLATVHGPTRLVLHEPYDIENPDSSIVEPMDRPLTA